ncbi:tyrosine-type recombinase/integrase [Tessaracoccus terricola]
MSQPALRSVPSAPAGRKPYERIFEALLPQFTQPMHVPGPEDVALWGRRCSVKGCCGWDSHGTQPLCAKHRRRLRYGRTSLTLSAGTGSGEDLTREQFANDPTANGGPFQNDHPGFDFTGMPQPLEFELRLLVQARSLQQQTYLRRQEFARIKQTALDAGLRSLLVPELMVEDRWLPTTPIPEAFKNNSGQVRAHLRFAISNVADLGWPVPLMERERWYAGDFNAASGRGKTITWTGYRQPWLKEWAKTWVKTRLAGNWNFSTAVAHASRLLYFSRFLADEHPEITGPSRLSREVLLDYVAWIKRVPDAAPSQRQGLVSTLKVLIEDHRLNDWEPAIPESAIIRHGELPRREEMLPRPIDDYVLRQILAPSNLALARPDLRTQLLILDGHGLRIGSVVELSIDCLGEDGDGFPTLRYRNTKRRRERLHPIRNPEVVDAIREQQRRTRERHPGTQWLFTPVVGNALGQRHITTSAVRVAFNDYLRRINPIDPDGRPVHIRPHQFRHTFGTRELNNGAPQEVVQELLDHDDPGMTRGYARLSGQRLREQFTAAARFSAAGERLDSLLPDSPLSDLAWMKERLNRAKVTLPNGYCALPLQQTCEVQNACLDCHDYFVTTPDFLPAHEAQRDHTIELIDAAAAAGQTRIAEKNRSVLVKLETLIASLRSSDERSS